MKKSRVAVVGCVGVPASYGGFETLVEHLTIALGTEFDLHIYCSSKRYTERPRKYQGATLHYIPFSPNGVSSIVYDIASMIHAILYAEIMLVLGVSGAMFLPIVKRFSKVRILVNIDGIEWKRQKWSELARKFLRRCERYAVEHADRVIADNVRIADYVAESYGVPADSIAYGGDHAQPVPAGESLKRVYPFLRSRFAVSVCRIEPENNVHMVLESFRTNAKMPLVVVGNWESSKYGTSLLNEFSDDENIFLLDPIYDPATLNCIRGNASLYVHGHSAGGTNPSLVEAMFLGLPVFAYDVRYNRATTEDCACYFRGADSLAKLVTELGPEDSRENAAKMYEIAQRRYRWSVISAEYAALLRG